MAEAFARTYGSDVMEAHSAGLLPAMAIPPETRKVMAEKNIDLADQFPKAFDLVRPSTFDLVVNLSGHRLPGRDWKSLREWKMRDPIGESEAVHRQVRDQIENLVMALVLELRSLRENWTKQFDSSAKR